ncbi:MAG: tetratricopeptide repeat protein [Cyanobacteria bacterium P01_F01_bin.116]
MATQLKSRKVLGLNQRQYEGLKTALKLNLRRQLLIAVCDSDSLQTQLVERLQLDLSAAESIDDFGSVELTKLTFDPRQPDLVVQLVHWLKQAPKPTPHLQVVGLDAMTHQPMRSQNHFLRSLESIQSLLPHIDSSLVLWLSWPWYRTLKQAAPEFWQWRSGVFTFVGKSVTEVPNVPKPDRPEGLYGDASPQQSADIWQILSEDLAQLEQPATPATTDIAAAAVNPAPASALAEESVAEESVAEESEPAEPVVAEPTVAESAVAASEPMEPMEPVTADAPATVATPETTATEPTNAETISQPLDITTVENPLETLAQLADQGSQPAELIQGYRTLGNHYRDRIEAGELTPELLATAIATFKLYLRWLPEDDEQRAAGLNDLGTLYWLNAQHQQEREALIAGMHSSAELYKTGLTCPNTDGETTSRVYGNLGAVYSALANYADPVTYLKEAITAYRQALPFSSAKDQPEEYGTLQNSLGSVYWKLAYYEQPKPHLHRAIAAYNEALNCHHPDSSPLDYAAVQNNLGIAYWSLSRHERPIFLLKHAIAAYRDALNYRTPSTDSVACASTYNNLGTAFWELANHPNAPADPEGRYKQNAVIAYEAALKASELSPAPSLDVVSIRHCLGSIYDKLARTAASPAVAGNLERALVHYVAALKVTPKTSATYEPMFKALVRNVSTHYEMLGLEGQQDALNKVPAELLPEVMLKL